MKYTNKHIKEEYKLNQIGRTIGMILLVIGIFLVTFGLIQTKRKMDSVIKFSKSIFLLIRFLIHIATYLYTE